MFDKNARGTAHDILLENRGKAEVKYPESLH